MPNNSKSTCALKNMLVYIGNSKNKEEREGERGLWLHIKEIQLVKAVVDQCVLKSI